MSAIRYFHRHAGSEGAGHTRIAATTIELLASSDTRPDFEGDEDLKDTGSGYSKVGCYCTRVSQEKKNMKVYANLRTEHDLKYHSIETYFQISLKINGINYINSYFKRNV